MQFKCTLLSDIILNQKAATEGNQETLDFIPGNNFLGIVAKIYDEFSPEDQINIFHSGKVRFGDAHPICGNNRTLRIPASMYYPKLKRVNEECYIYHLYDREKEAKKKQLKQCRRGFYSFSNNQCEKVEVGKTFAIKSAYDREKRRSKDEQMFGYQSIDKGVEFYFEVDTDSNISNELRKKVNDALIGIKRVGRSRTAQYGLVEITSAIFENVQSTTTTIQIDGKKCITVYADSRLIFLNQYGIPTFMPTAMDLGLEDGAIWWEKSQIRTFQYAPWNFKRQARDADRCGIEKGSVFVIVIDKLPDISDMPHYVGSYKSEGFGKVIINPDFLNASEANNGKATYRFIETTKAKTEKLEYTESLSETDSLLFTYLSSAKEEEEKESTVYKLVNEFVKDNLKYFLSESFASQWGTIRSISMQYPDKDKLKENLFAKEPIQNDKQVDFAYLTHGIAKDKWDEKGRRDKLKEFFDKLEPDMAQFALINLSAEMAKKCKGK